MDISGNTVLITGGAGGIGLLLADRLSALGNRLIVTGRNPEKLREAEARIPGLTAIRSDLSEAESIAALHDEVMRIAPELNILVNNAGSMRKLSLLSSTGDLRDITREVESNLMGPIRMVAEFLPDLECADRPAIVNVTSGLAFVPWPIAPIYCATKAGLHSYTVSLRIQLAKTKVKVFELMPQATRTGLLGAFDESDFAGISTMPVEKLVSAAINGLRKDTFEIRPGQSNVLRLMNRIAPKFIQGQMTKAVPALVAQTD